MQPLLTSQLITATTLDQNEATMKSPLSTHYSSGIAGAAFKSARISSLIFDALLLVVLLSLPGWASSVLYSQPWSGTGSVWASQNDTASLGNFATVYDNFHFGPAAAPGQPGNPIATGTFSGNGDEKLCQVVSGTPICFYDLMGLGSILLAPNAQYWISLVPDLSFPPQWGWATGTGGEGRAWQCFFGTCGPLATDMAFTLLGTGTHLDEVQFYGGYFNPSQQGTITAWTVTLYTDIPAPTPEPGSLLLMASGVLSVGGLMWRRLLG